MYKIPLANLNATPRPNPILEASYSRFVDISARKRLKEKPGNNPNYMAFMLEETSLDEIKNMIGEDN